uniref:Recep_L_domain domain-containing protein n=1 Tax=Strongyloides venezuelensis TaxID=75913 RepID=A0A0K0FG77_STRVS
MPMKLLLLQLIVTSLCIFTFPKEINKNYDNNGVVLVAPISKVRKELEEIASRPDLLCNLESDYECLCHQSLGDLEGKYIPCNEFIQIENLPTIQLKLKNANLSARLHTNEPFEEYFKRRIADILSRYCQNNINECNGVHNPNTKVDSNEENNVDKTFITQEQVIILAVNYLPNKITLVDLVVAKEPNIGSLNGLMLMDPVQVKFILSAQSTPLSRVLGGIKIEGVKTNSLSRETPPSILESDDNTDPLLPPAYITPTQSMNPQEEEQIKQNAGDNSTLKILLLIVGTFLAICYIIAIYKVCRDHHIKKKARARAEASFVPSRSNSIRNYGTLASQKSHQTDGGTSITTKTNVSHLNKTNVFGDGNNNKNLQHSNVSPTTGGWSNGEEEGSITPAITPHTFKRMFMCDASQLPREPTIDLESQIIEEQENGEVRKIEHPMDFGIPIPHHEEDEEGEREGENEYPSVTDMTPDLIVDSESLPDYELSNINVKNTENSMLTTMVQTERPISRRGSLTSPHLDQQDLETTNSREETPAPIMEEDMATKQPVIVEEEEPIPIVNNETVNNNSNDISDNNNKSSSRPKIIPVVSITVDDDVIIEDEFDDRNDAFNTIVNDKSDINNETWSTDEEEEGDDKDNINLYRIMSEEHIEESEKSEEEEDEDESTYYQRLQESPTIPFEVTSPNNVQKDRHLVNNHIQPNRVLEDNGDEDLR